MTPETERLIGEIERTLEAATPGPWAQCARFRRLIIPEWQQGRKVGGSADRNRDHTEYVQPVADIFELEKLRHRGAAEVQANADLVSSAPSWLSALLSALREAEAEREAIQETLTQAEHDVAIVYCHVTNSQISKINTDPQVVKQVSDDYTMKLVDEETAGYRQEVDDLQAEVTRLREALNRAEADLKRQQHEWHAEVADVIQTERKAAEVEAARLREAIHLDGEDAEFYFLSDPEGRLFVNLNDTFGYACADAEPIPWDEFDAVIAEWRRDKRSLLLWAARKRGMDVAELIKDKRVPPKTRECLQAAQAAAGREG